MSTFLSRMIAPSDPFASTTTQEVMLGTPGVTPDGRKYRYAKAGTSALTRGQLCVAATVVANHQNLACTAASAGAYEVTVTLGATAATADQYKDGFLVINDVDGEGTAFRITGHPAAASAGSLTVKLAQPLEVALTANSEASLQNNPYDSVVVSVTDQADMPVGIPNTNIGASEYFWLQTGGPCSALADETLAVGSQLTTGTGVAGAVEVIDAIGEPPVGVALQAGVDTEYRLISLTLDPG